MDLEKDAINIVTSLGPWALGAWIVAWFRKPLTERITSSPIKGKLGDSEFNLGIAESQAEAPGQASSPVAENLSATNPLTPIAVRASEDSAIEEMTTTERTLREGMWRLGLGWKYERIWRLIIAQQYQLLSKHAQSEVVSTSDSLSFYEQLSEDVRSRFSFISFMHYLTNHGLIAYVTSGPEALTRITEEGRLFIKFIDMTIESITWPTVAPNNPWVAPLSIFEKPTRS